LTIDVWKEKMLLYKDAVMPIEGIAPVSQSWAKKHILGFSDEEIKLDLQQQRVEKAVATEIQNTANVITRTGIFDTVDKLYGNGGKTVTGETETTDTEFDAGGLGTDEAPIPAEVGGEVTPESLEKRINVITERDDFTTISEIDLEKGKRFLGEIENELRKIMD
jgi:hypothetical protein